MVKCDCFTLKGCTGLGGEEEAQAVAVAGYLFRGGGQTL